MKIFNEDRIFIVWVFLLPVFLSPFLKCGDVMAYEEAKYTVIEKDGDFELRQFEPRIVAETIVEGEFDEVGSEGFRRLFKYISGNNRIKQTIPMTAPVTREMKSEKLPMTAPVTQEKAGDKWRIAFLMPSKFTLETLPEPLDPGIELKEIPGSLMAVLVYSGTWSRARYEEKRAELEKL
ncbi:MAG: heme-binding protein, partial [Nitrospirota bacterium]|nr:heme-binding protein [Nitrospirota bacterium]